MNHRTFSWSDTQDRQAIIDMLEQQRVCIGSTDTILGLMGKVDPKVSQKIDNMKQRKEKPYLILIDTLEQAEQLAEIDARLRAFLSLIWPAPVTVILPKKETAPGYVGTADTVGIRMPHHEGLRAVASHFQYGIFSTSANLTGQPVPTQLADVAPHILDAVACVVDDGPNKVAASTIVDLTKGEPIIIRQGDIGEQAIDTLYQACQ